MDGITRVYSCVLELHAFARKTTEVPISPRLRVAAIRYSSDTLWHA